MRLSTPYYRALNFMVVGVFVVVIGGTMVEDGAAEWPALIALVVAVGLLVRVARLGITVDEERIVVRSWFRTRRIPRAELVGARAAEYDGWWGSCPFECVNQLELELRGREEPLAVRAIVATRRSRRVQRIAYQLRRSS